ncbi:MAG TPA: hypothetical protein V6D43_24185 [Candidatus Sericytochromatia bacterium]|jgi:hypothetical protein
MSAKTEQCQLDSDLMLHDRTTTPLTVRAISLSLIKQDDEVIECRLTFQVSPQLYQRIETEALFNLKPEMRRPLSAGNFLPEEVVRVGGDARVLPDKFGNTPKSFDLTVENRAGAVTRNIDVTTIKDPIEGSSDFKDGLKHAIDKAPVAKQGSIESTIQVEIPDSPVQLGNGRQKHFGSDGRYAITELSGQSRISQGDLFEELKNYIPKVDTGNVLKRVNIVDKNGALIATLENVNRTWKISARYK